jgi:hypothetical protein
LQESERGEVVGVRETHLGRIRKKLRRQGARLSKVSTHRGIGIDLAALIGVAGAAGATSYTARKSLSR